MRKAIEVFCLCLCMGGVLSTPARADEATDAALQAAENLRGAIDAMDRATSADERIAALTVTISAYEDGLAALRSGLRQIADQENEIKKGFDAQRAEVGRLLGVMATMQQSSGPLLLLHPSGPVGTAQSGMILGAVTPALQEKAQAMSVKLEDIRQMRQVQQGAISVLEAGMTSVQGARAALSQAVAERQALPGRYLETPDDLRQLVQSADTLDGFASGILDLDSDIGAPMEDFESVKGDLELPVEGGLLRKFNEADAAGIKRPGWVISTAPAALVTAPWPATIRYRGPLLDYGNVMVIEPYDGYLLVLAGMGTVYGEIGDVVPQGGALGLMGGAEPSAREFGVDFVSDATQDSGATRPETLYMELRKGNEPIDPAEWFARSSN